MSTVLNTDGKLLEIPKGDYSGMKFAVVTADWNHEITGALLEGALGVFAEAGVTVVQERVPGTVELVYAAAVLVQAGYDAVVTLGCVIRGDTPHFDYVCEHTTEGIARINSEGVSPVIFGVLTVNDLQQAKDRAGGSLGNKGAEAAVAALTMAQLKHRVQD